MKAFFNYANGCCYNAQKRSILAAQRHGGFDACFPFSATDIDPIFYEQNKSILSLGRGAGYWIWKYHLAMRLLDGSLGQLPEGSYICYCDSDLYFSKPIAHAISCLERDDNNKSIMVFRGLYNLRSSNQTKRDAFVICEADTPDFIQSCNRAAGLFLFKKDDVARNFFATMLKYCCDPRCIMPPKKQPGGPSNLPGAMDNQMGFPNYPDFMRHAEDETILTIVAKKFGLYPYRWPSLSKDQESKRLRYELQHGVHWMSPNVVSEVQYPPLRPNKSDYPAFIQFSSDKD